MATEAAVATAPAIAAPKSIQHPGAGGGSEASPWRAVQAVVLSPDGEVRAHHLQARLVQAELDRRVDAANQERVARRLQTMRAGWRVRRRVLPASRRVQRCLLLGESMGEKLYGYQLEGVRWLSAAWALGGGILGDGVGLGKAVQALALVEALVRRRAATRVLIVTPAHMTKPWQQEMEKCP